MVVPSVSSFPPREELLATNAALRAENAALRKRLDHGRTATLSHELLTALALVLGPVDVLRARAELPRDARRTLDRVHRNGWRIKTLLDELLDAGEPAEPLPERASEPPAPSSPSSAPASVTDRRPCIVLADDNAEMRAYIVSILSGYRVVACRDGQEALAAVRKHRPDAIVTDMMMPEMDGSQLLMAVKNDPELRETPVIVVTALAGRAALSDTLHSGADDFLEKPFTPAELVARVGVAVRLRLATKALVEKNEEIVRTLDTIVEMEKLAALGRMLSQIAHEINNPMCAVVGNIDPLGEYLDAIETMLRAYAAAEAIAGPGGDALRAQRAELEIEFVLEDFRACLACVREGVDRVRAIQSDLRSFMRGGAPTNEEADLNDALRATVDMIRRALPPDVSIDASYGPVPRLVVNVGQLKQVFLNLLQNAADALGSRGSIELATCVQGGVIQVTVTNDGAGIAPGLRQKIFEPFFTTKDVGKGTGLGLAVCRQILAAHGGSIRLDERTQGTQFIVELPLLETPIPS